MTKTEAKTQKLQKNVHNASLDLADAIIDLAEQKVLTSKWDRERVNAARVFLHELVGGDKPRAVPFTDVLFTIGLVFDELGRLPMTFEMHAAVSRLSRALEMLTAKKDGSGGTETGSGSAPAFRPPGVPWTADLRRPAPKPLKRRKFYRPREFYPWGYA